MTLALLPLVALALAGCGPTLPVVPPLGHVSYDATVARAPAKSGSLHVTTGAVESDSLGLQTGPFQWVHPQALFHLQDQRAFADSLKGELNRLGLLRVASVSWQEVEPAEVTVELVFQRTVLFPGQRYALDAVMRLKSGEHSFARRYFVRSWEGESIPWTSTGVPHGKALAAKKLMARLIPEIEAFVLKPDEK